MNRTLLCQAFAAVFVGGLLFAAGVHAQTPPPPNPRVSPQFAPRPATRPPLVPDSAEQGKKTATGESFFIVASVDLQRSQVLLKYPTEVTLLVKVTDKTQFVDNLGKPIKLTDFRAGDTVWLTTTGGAGEPTALRIRKGEMTVADLHRYYLDYPEIK